MIKKRKNVIVYHASYEKIENIDLSFSKPNKDFGEGFYVTTDYEQAKKFAYLISKRKKVKKAHINKYMLSNFDNLEVLEFNGADIEWLKCISGFRNTEKQKYLKKYLKNDVIIGKVADDNTSLVINAYMRGAFGDLNNSKVMEVVIERLMVDKLTDQICFKTIKSLQKLKFIESEVIKYA